MLTLQRDDLIIDDVLMALGVVFHDVEFHVILRSSDPSDTLDLSCPAGGQSLFQKPNRPRMLEWLVISGFQRCDDGDYDPSEES